ncbi:MULTISPECIES: DUF86 domain-containing protein [Desulfitobacterium]|nr:MULTISPECIES: DUF86 domain-containing protein [Desulfitobacterium]
MYLEDIIGCMEKIELYVGELSYEDFTKNSLVFDAVIRNLEVIGEASKSIPEETVSNYPDISWRSMIGLRNILIHEYFGVDSEIVWEIIKSDLPRTKPLIIQMLNELK